MSSNEEGRRRISEAALQKVEELADALAAGSVDAQAALETLVNIAAKGAQPSEAWQRVHDVAVEHNKVADLAFGYEHVTATKRMKLLPPEQQAYVFLRAAEFLADIFGDPEGAVAYAERALAAAPAHSEAVALMERLLLASNNHARLAKLYVNLSGTEQERERQLELLDKAAEVLGEGEAAHDLAVDIYQKILRLEPTRDAASEALFSRLLAAGQHREAVKWLEQSLQREPPPSPEEAKAAHEKALELYVFEIKEPARAIVHIEALLAQDPNHPLALQTAEALLENRAVAQRAAAALSDAYEKSGNVASAVAMLTTELKLVRGPRRIEVQKRLAILRQDALEDPQGALELLGPVVAGDPGDDDLRQRFVSLSLELGKLREAARLLSRALQTSRDPAVRARVGVHVGEVYVKSGEIRRAQAAFQQVIETGHDESATLAAARQLAELHANAGDTKALAFALELVVQHEPDKERCQAAARRLTRLYEDELGDPQRAVNAWRALIGSPWTDEALTKLEALYTELDSQQGLADVLDERAERAKDPEKARELAFKAAELRTTRTRDRQAALQAWRNFVERYGASREVHERMVILLEQAQLWEELTQVLERDVALATAEEQPAMLVRLAQLCQTRLDDNTRAIEALAHALRVAPDDKASRAAVEKLLASGDAQAQLRAADILEPLYRNEPPGAGLIKMLEVRGQLSEDPDTRRNALREAVEVLRSQLTNPERGVEVAGLGLAEAVAHARSEIQEWLKQTQQFAHEAGDEARYAAVLSQALGDAEPNSSEIRMLTRATADALVAAGDVDGGIELYRRALQHDPSSPELLARLDELLTLQGSPQERLNLYSSALAQEQEPARRRELFRTIARVQRRDLGDVDGALATWQRALEEEPRDYIAHQTLIDIHSERGDLQSAYAELERGLPHLEGDRRAATLAKLAEVAAAVGDRTRALAAYRELLEAEQLDDSVLEQVEKVASEEADYQLVKTMLERRLHTANDPIEQANLLERLGSVLAWELSDTAAAAEIWLKGARLSEGIAADSEQARRFYENVLIVSSEHREAAERLLELYARAGLWESMGQAYSVLLQVSSPRDLIATLLSLEESALQGGGASALVKLIDATLELELDAAKARQLQVAKARLLSSDLASADEAVSIYTSLLEAPDETDLSAEVQALESFLEEHPERVTDRRWLLQWRSKHSSEPIPTLLAWAEMEERSFGDSAAAMRLYERILELDAERTDALTELARLRAAHGDPEGALESLRGLAERSEGLQRTAAELSMAKLLVESLERPLEALEIVAPMLEQIPMDPEALAIVQRSLQTREARVRAAELLEQSIEATDDLTVRAAGFEALLAVSADSPEMGEARSRWLKRLLEIKSDDPASCYEIALRAAEEAGGDEELWDAAERFARQLNEPAPLAEAYARVIEQPLDSEVAENLGRRMVEFQEEWFDDPERVIYLLERVLSLSPDAHWAFDRLKLAFNSQGRWPQLFQLYDRGLDSARSDETKIELLREASMAAKDFAGDAERAISYLEHLNELSPRDPRVEASLERLYERLGRTRPLIELLSVQLADAEGSHAAELRARIAGLWLELDEPLPAFELVKKMLANDPDSEPAFALLEKLVAMPATEDLVVPPSTRKGSKRPPSPQDARTSVRERSAALLKDHYEKIGSTQDVVRMLDVEVQTAPNDAERIRRLSEIAQVRLEQLDDVAGAFDNVASLVELEPENAAHRQLLAELAQRLRSFERQGEVLYEVALEQNDALALKASYLCEAASVYRQQLENAARAIELYLDVLALKEHDADSALEAARRLDEMLAAAERTEDRCAVLEQLAILEPEPQAKQRAYGEAARLSFEHLADPSRAIVSWRARLEMDAEDRDALDGIAMALRAAGRWDELIDVLSTRERVLSAAPESARADGVARARVHAEQRGDRLAAIETWRHVRIEYGRDEETYQALHELLSAEHLWTDLAQLVDEQASEQSDSGLNAELLRTLGEVHRDRTGDALAALQAFVAAGDWKDATQVAGASHRDKELGRELFRELLNLAVATWEREQSGPQSGAAQAAGWAVNELCQRLQESGDNEAVVQLLLKGANLPFEAHQRRDFKREAACLCSDRLDDSERAIAIFREIFAEDPGDEVAAASVTRLALLLEERGLHSEIVALWEQQAECREVGRDPAGAALLWARAGELAERRLEDIDRAIQDYRRGAGLGGEASLDALARIYSEQGEHFQAAEVLEWFCAQSPRELLAERALRLANAYVDAGEKKRARARLEQAAARAIDAGAVRKRLAELYREAGEWAQLAALLADEATRASDAKQRLDLLCEAADLHLKQRKDPNAAVPLLSDAVALSPDLPQLRLSLSDALRQAERYDEAIVILREQIERYGSRRPKDRALVHYQLARVCLAAQKRAEALAELDAATRIDPAHPGILQALARLAFEEGQLERAERMYRGLLLVVGRDDDPDGPSRAESLLDLSEIARRQADETRAIEFVESAFEAALESEREARALEKTLRERNQSALLVRALERRLDQRLNATEAAKVLSSFVELRMEQEGLGESMEAVKDRAREILKGLESSDSTDAEAWASLARVFERVGDPEAQGQVLDRQVSALEKSDPKQEDALIFYDAAELKLDDDLERALELLERALELKSDLERAHGLLKRAVPQQPDNEKLVALLERAARGLRDQRSLLEALTLRIQLPGPQHQAIREATSIAQDLGDLAAAEGILRRGIAKGEEEEVEASQRVWIRVELAGICAQDGRLDEALDLREQAASFAESSERRTLLLEVARAAMESEQYERAARIYTDLRSAEPQDRELWEPLLQLHRRLGNNDELVRLLDETVPLVDSLQDRARLRLEEANILLSQPEREDDAIARLKDILVEDPAQVEAAMLLGDALERRGRHDELVALLTSQIDAAKDREDVASVISLSKKLVALLESQERLRDGLDVCRAALEWDRDNRELLQTAVRLCEGSGDEEALADSIEALLRIESGDEAIRLANRLVALREQQGDISGKERALELAMEANPSDAGVRDALVSRYTEQGDYAAVARVLRRAVKASPGDPSLLQRLVDAYRASGDPEGALEIIEGLLESEPDNAEILRKRAKAYEDLGRENDALRDMTRAHELSGQLAGELTGMLERAAEKAEGEERAGLLLRLVEVLEQAGQHGDARSKLDDIVREFPKHRDALRRLAGAEAEAENWVAASATYRKLIAIEEGPAMVEVALKLADACARAERFEDARGALERAINVAPENPELHQALRRIYEAIGANRELAQLELQGTSASSDVGERLQHLLRAGELLLGDDGDVDEAIRVLEEARGLSPESVEGIALLARAHFTAGRADQAINMLNEVIAAHRGRRSRALIVVYEELARIHLAEGFLTDALEAMTRAFEIDLKNHQLAMRLGRLALDMDEEQTATRAFRTVTMMKTSDDPAEGVTKPTKAEAHYQLALLAFRQGDPRKAKVLASKALSEDPSVDGAQNLIAELEANHLSTPPAGGKA